MTDYSAAQWVRRREQDVMRAIIRAAIDLSGVGAQLAGHAYAWVVHADVLSPIRRHVRRRIMQ